MIHNTVGRPVQGDDFFDRKREVEELWSRLETDDVLLLAPRRVGKTSLMYRLNEQSSARSIQSIYVSVADATTELAFARKILAAVSGHKSSEKVLQWLKDSSVGQLLSRVGKVGVAGAVEVELKDEVEKHWSVVGEAIVQALSAIGPRWVLLLDEVPVFVLALLRADPSGSRARDFMNWFRTLRQHPETGRNVRWLLAGSIGLDTVTRRMNLGDTINDLFLYSDFGAFSRPAAFALLNQLAEAYGMTLSDEVKERICDRIGWLIPYHLQLCFSDLKSAYPRGTPSPADVDAVYEQLLSPAKKSYFDFWRQRLTEELGPPDDGRAIRLLNRVAVDDRGATRQTLSGALSKAVRDPAKRQQHLMFLTDVLVSDGYLVEQDGRFLFRSSLLRDFWRRNTV